MEHVCEGEGARAFTWRARPGRGKNIGKRRDRNTDGARITRQRHTAAPAHTDKHLRRPVVGGVEHLRAPTHAAPTTGAPPGSQRSAETRAPPASALLIARAAAPDSASNARPPGTTPACATRGSTAVV